MDDKINICKKCKKPYSNHISSDFTMPYWCFKENQVIDFVQAGWSFEQMDNLDYIEWVAKQKNLV